MSALDGPARRGRQAAAPREATRFDRTGSWWVHARCWAGDHPPSQPPVVLVHGLGVASRMCQPLAHRLASRHPVYALDLPGFGRSDKPDRTLDVGGLGAALAGWIRAVGLDDAVLVGTSLGSQVAVDAVARHAVRCRLLVLAAPTVDRRRRRWRSQLWRWQVERATQSRRLRRIQVRDLAHCGPTRVVRTFAAALDDRPEDKLADVDAPVSVCRGTRDPLVSRRWAAELAGRARNGRLAVLPGATHALSHDNPLELARVTARDLDEPTRGAVTPRTQTGHT